MRRALFPGTFDPFHHGHLDVVKAACRMFDEVIVAAFNSTKGSALFSLEEREELIAESLSEPSNGELDNVLVTSCSTLVAELARDLEVSVLVRGLRAITDFEFELQIAQMNHHLAGVDTVFVPTSSERSFLASHLIREVALFGGDVSGFVAPAVVERLATKVRTP